MPPPSPTDTLRRGIICLVASIVLIACSDAVAKLMTTRVPVVEIALVQSLILMLSVPVFFRHDRLVSLFATRHLGLQITRSVCSLVSALAFFTGLRYLPLADIVAIIFIGPLLVTILGALVLAEEVGPRRWAACLVGFGGALVVVRPVFGGIGWTALYPLAAAGFYAVYVICTRKIATTERHGTMMLYTGVVSVVVLGLSAPTYWVTPSPQGFAGLIAIGMLSCASAALGIRAYALAPASTLAPYAYVEIIAATALGFIVFGDIPDGFTILGALIVAGSGLYVYHREQVAAARR